MVQQRKEEDNSFEGAMYKSNYYDEYYWRQWSFQCVLFDLNNEWIGMQHELDICCYEGLLKLINSVRNSVAY